MLGARNLARRLYDLAAGHLRPPELPRPPSTASFPRIDPSQQIEEERLPWYDPQDFYPVRIGDVFKSQYQVLGKLGYGAYSTVWLCCDLVRHRYVTVKVCTRNSVPVKRELSALNYLNNLPKTKHEGRTLVRTMLDEFTLTLPSEHAAATVSSESQPTDRVPSRPFQCIVHKPMLMSLFAFRHKLRTAKFHENFLKSVLCHIFTALDYLHSEAKLIHADIQEKNIILNLDDLPALEAFDRDEQASPSPRKDAGDRTIYLSRKVVTAVKNYGQPVLCDFGEARFGHATYTGPIQPYQYRAPEVILGMPWDEKVDIWSVGVMIWNMFEGRDMFNTSGGPEDEDDNLYHLAHMVALLGPPPADFLRRSETDEPWRYFDAQGKSNWIGATSVPDDSLEQSDTILEGEAKARFLEVVRKMVRWKPEDRCSAKELMADPWVNSF